LGGGERRSQGGQGINPGFKQQAKPGRKEMRRHSKDSIPKKGQDGIKPPVE